MSETMARLVLAVTLAAAFGLFSRPSWAQEQNSLFFRDPGFPLRIWSDQLTVNDKNRIAIFSGHAVVTQGPARMDCASVVVHYSKRASGRDGIDRLECKHLRMAD